MKTMIIKDQEQGEALIDVQKICLVTKPNMKKCKSPSGAEQDKLVLEIFFTGTRTALFFNDEEEAMDMYQEIMIAMKQEETPQYSYVPYTTHTGGNITVQPDNTGSPEITWYTTSGEYTPGRGDVNFGPMR